MYTIGIDGGGTKTAFGLFDTNGHCLQQLELPTSHYLQVGFEGCAKCLQKGIEELMISNHLTNQEVQVGIGIAGYGCDEAIREQLEKHISKRLPLINYRLTNDMHIALIGALNGQDGIAVVAGTGTIALAQVNHQLIRCGGWGYQLGDEGSAYWIGKKLLKEFCQQADGRVPQDDIYKRVMDMYHMKNPYQIISIMNEFDNERTEVAKLSLLCHQLASSGNQKCQNIFIQAAKHTTELIDGLSPYFDNQIKVTYYGGVFQNYLFKQTFINHFDNRFQLVEPINDALYGAYLLINNNY